MIPRKVAGGRLIYVGAGTSGRLAVLDAVECVPTFGIEKEQVVAILAGGSAAMMEAQEGAEDNEEAGHDAIQALELKSVDIVVGISASGRTPFVCAAISGAKMSGCMTVGISCSEPAPLLDMVLHPIPLLVGPEVLSGSTRLKAGTAQKMVLNMISTTLMAKTGHVFGHYMVALRLNSQKLYIRARRILCDLAKIDDQTASALLHQAQGQVRIALVMAWCDCDVEGAKKRLEAVGGDLRQIQ